MLSPLILVDSTEQEFVLGNFNKGIKPEIYKKYKLNLVKDFGDGVMLFRKENK
jgi:hypothetical protein